MAASQHCLHIYIGTADLLEQLTQGATPKGADGVAEEIQLGQRGDEPAELKLSCHHLAVHRAQPLVRKVRALLALFQATESAHTCGGALDRRQQGGQAVISDVMWFLRQFSSVIVALNEVASLPHAAGPMPVSATMNVLIWLCLSESQRAIHRLWS